MVETGEQLIEVEYYALLRDRAGCARESVRTRAMDARALYAELQARHGFALAPEHLRVAINDDFAAWDQRLQAGDRVVFIPPVAGG